jgi:hypothetical protein
MVIETLLIVLAVLVLGVAAYVRAQAKASMALASREFEVPPVPVVVPPPAPAPPAPTPAPAKPDTIVCRFVSEGGRALGSVTIDRKLRRPTMTYTQKNGRVDTFVFEQKAGREHRYRRVGTERL